MAVKANLKSDIGRFGLILRVGGRGHSPCQRLLPASLPTSFLRVKLSSALKGLGLRIYLQGSGLRVYLAGRLQAWAIERHYDGAAVRIVPSGAAPYM